MRVLEYGKEQEKTLLFLPCTAEPAWAFADSVALLSQEYHVMQIVYDGHGETGDDFISVETTVAEVTDWLKSHGITRLNAAYGCSLGGACLTRFLALGEIPVERAVIDAGITPYRMPLILRRLACLRDDLGFRLLAKNRKVLETVYPPERWTLPGRDPVKEYDALEAYLKTYSKRTVRSIFWSANNYTLPKKPAETGCQITYWYGEEEKQARHSNICFIQQYFPWVELKEIPRIDEYEKWVISYTKDLRLPMMFYTAAVNGVFAFLIAGGLLFTSHGVTTGFLLNLLFYIIITPVISLTLTRMMYMSESKLVVADALARIDSVLEAAPMQGQAVPQHPQDASVTLQDVTDTTEDMDSLLKRGENYTAGCGGLFSTLHDYDRFAHMLLNGGAVDGVRVLQPETVRLMGQPGSPDYPDPDPGCAWGLGMKIRKDPQKAKSACTADTFGWSGAFGTHFFVSPKDHLSAVWMMNRSDIDGAGSYISQTIEELVFGCFA